ncbi:hypothetical protein HK103_002529 [Boothiomyces macroporosus]|uniref:Uncharacterized protein n=1 Tax=Boothiomyces macroporosus TaxID=261099 RepID=A0AAD5Y4R6_9FUNG|nr:hypothetical protein HK103_002529 [Boothiomyces macroporosus]
MTSGEVIKISKKDNSVKYIKKEPVTTTDIFNFQKIENELEETEKGILKKENINKKKKKVKLSKATFKDCERDDGLHLNLQYVTEEYEDITTLHLPMEIQERKDLVPTKLLCDYLEMLESVWVFNHEFMCRSKIDAIFACALRSHANGQKSKLRAFGEVNNSCETAGVSYRGFVDYMIGSGQFKDSPASKIDSFIIAVEAKREWPDQAVAQVITEAGCLLKNRLKAGKKTPVFAILTNSRFFKFYAIDIKGVVYSSGSEIKLVKGKSWESSKSLKLIWKWLYWFFNSMKLISPRCSTTELSDERINENIEAISKHFGSEQSDQDGFDRVSTE